MAWIYQYKSSKLFFKINSTHHTSMMTIRSVGTSQSTIIGCHARPVAVSSGIQPRCVPIHSSKQFNGYGSGSLPNTVMPAVRRGTVRQGMFFFWPNDAP